jgi:glycosyltransferase involved in cell wall biosynthesis
MRVLLSSKHRFPAYDESGSGRKPMEWPSGSAFLIHDLIARGLSELGHSVFYLLSGGARDTLPAGVALVSEPVFDVDILHCEGGKDDALTRCMEEHGIPWVATCHLDPRIATGNLRAKAPHNWIFVSQTLARSLGWERYVWNGLDPAAYRFSESKSGYFLFISSLERADQKGLDIALRLAGEIGFKLVVAGTGRTWELIQAVERKCRASGAEYVGDVRGIEKANLFANAAALVFPTQLNEAFGLTIVEAWLSGTPVICSDYGACPEIMTPETGFVCKTWADYTLAVENVHNIRPAVCHQRALREFHYTTMSRGYETEYVQELQGFASSRG